MSAPAPPSGEPVGVVGLGTIGGAIAERLLGAGRAVVGFDPAAAARDRLGELGGVAVDRPVAVAARASTVLLAVPAGGDVEATCSGEEGLEAGLASGACVAVMSTVEPATPIRLAERLGPRGIEVVDVPLSGGPERARRGELTLMVGGTEEGFGRVEPTLAVIGQRIVHVGPIGHGEVAKLANNLAGAVITLGLAEALSLAAKAGANVERVAEAIGSASGSSWILREWLPATTFAGDYSPRFRLDLMNKDLTLIARLADELDVDVPALELCSRAFADAADAGLGDRDFSALIDLHAQRSGTTVRPGS